MPLGFAEEEVRMARRKRVIKKLRRAEVGGASCSEAAATAASRADHRCGMQMATGACSATSWSANAIGVWLKYWEPIPANSRCTYLNRVFGY